MSAPRASYVCQNCGYETPRWVGRCPSCNEWNTLVEELKTKIPASRRRGAAASAAPAAPIPLGSISGGEEPRVASGIGELDRVLGGGIVPGSVVLVGGDPGIGKSTLMLQLAARLSGRTILYVSGEESPRQIKLRAERLAVAAPERLFILPETDADVVAETARRTAPDLMIVDSVQTMTRGGLESSPGSVAQVRETSALFTRLAKERSLPLFLIGHVTKEGSIAGPKVIEHMVDTVLQFEGDRHHAYRILRAAKNRFGSTNEIGVFEMREGGLEEVQNPSEVFLAERSADGTGSAVVATMEGSRPILVEVQALVSPAGYGMPQRSTTGFDYRRLGLLVAVIERRMGIELGRHDVFVNVAGGIRIDDPAADLGIAVAIVSSVRERPVDPASVTVGEVGLGGEVRGVSAPDRRVAEAAKLGFRRAVVPSHSRQRLQAPKGIDLAGAGRLEEAVAMLIG